MNCKPGDLAYLRCAQIPENVGKVVEVVSPYLHGLDQFGEFSWRCKTTSRIPCVYKNSQISYDNIFAVPDLWLVPIAGPSTSTDTREEKELEYVR